MYISVNDNLIKIANDKGVRETVVQRIADRLTDIGIIYDESNFGDILDMIKDVVYDTNELNHIIISMGVLHIPKELLIKAAKERKLI